MKAAITSLETELKEYKHFSFVQIVFFQLTCSENRQQSFKHYFCDIEGSKDVTEKPLWQNPQHLKPTQLGTILTQKNTNVPPLSATEPHQNKTMQLDLLSRLNGVSEPIVPFLSAS